MRSIAIILVASLPATASSAPAAILLMRSAGRAVKIEIRQGDGWKRCTTPCRLSLPPGRHGARIDGLDRRVDLQPGENRYEVEPTRRARQILGIVAAGLGSTGLTLAGQPTVRLDGEIRLAMALSGLALTGLAVPLICGSSARLSRLDGAAAAPSSRRPARPRLELSAGTEYLLGSNLPASDDELPWRLTLAGGYYVTDSVSLGVKGRLGGPQGIGRGYAVLGQATARIRVPLVFLFTSLGAGYRGQEDTRGHDGGFALELEAGLRLPLWRGLSVAASATYQLGSSHLPESGWRHGALGGVGISLTL